MGKNGMLKAISVVATVISLYRGFIVGGSVDEIIVVLSISLALLLMSEMGRKGVISGKGNFARMARVSGG
jgi:hypothetical protein